MRKTAIATGVALALLAGTADAAVIVGDRTNANARAYGGDATATGVGLGGSANSSSNATGVGIANSKSKSSANSRSSAGAVSYGYVEGSQRQTAKQSARQGQLQGQVNEGNSVVIEDNSVYDAPISSAPDMVANTTTNCAIGVAGSLSIPGFNGGIGTAIVNDECVRRATIEMLKGIPGSQRLIARLVLDLKPVKEAMAADGFTVVQGKVVRAPVTTRKSPVAFGDDDGFTPADGN